MIFKWTIKNCLLQESDHVLAEKVLCEFGIDNEDIVFGPDQIIGVPKLKLEWTHFVSPVRISVYDIKMQIDRKEKTVKFKFRLYKLLAIAFLFFLFISAIEANLIGGVIFFFGAISFFGVSTILQLIVNIITITDILKPMGRIE